METIFETSLIRVASAMELLFGGDVAEQPLMLHQIAARSIVLYIIGGLLLRIGKSRLMGRITLVDVLVGFILGSLLSRAITGGASVSATTAACTAIVGIHYLFTAIAFHSHWFGKIVKGHAKVIVQDGQPLNNELRRSHISMHDLISAIRLQGVEDLAQVKVAYKERNGQISVIKLPLTPKVVATDVANGIQKVVVEFRPPD